jgi:DNA-binding CsgD family transcriptional regulator
MAPEAGKIKKRPTIDRVTQTSADIIRLLVQLANPADDRGDPNVQANPSEEIILEADLDGARYVLIRIPNANRPRVQLSPREQEIVRMVADGHSNKIIAKVLSISSWTVCTHLRRIFAKLGVGSRAAMVARLLELCGTREHSYQRLPACSIVGPGNAREVTSRSSRKMELDQKPETQEPKPR